MDALRKGRPLETAIVATHLTLLAELPDTLIARKCGPDVARDAAHRASLVLAAGWPDRAEGVRLCDEFDHWLRDGGHARNPGATADLVSAALFAGLRDATITLPMFVGGWSGPRGPFD